jgi:hypothetical protein
MVAGSTAGSAGAAWQSQILSSMHGVHGREKQMRRIGYIGYAADKTQASTRRLGCIGYADCTGGYLRIDRELALKAHNLIAGRNLSHRSRRGGMPHTG